MKERARINFSETTKEVQADVTLEWEGENINKDELLKELILLYEKAKAYAHTQTMKKLVGK